VSAERVVIVGAGIAGLAAAVELAARGLAVTVLERASTPGGKMRELSVGGARLDGGPTVLTLRTVFEDLFATAGTTLERELTLTAAEVLARHAWSATERLDLYADVERSVEAIGDFAGAAEARRFREFTDRARRIYEALDAPFLGAATPSLVTLARHAGANSLATLATISPFQRLWGAVAGYFRDPRLRQLYARYATYCGSSPFAAPATLMLVAHVEQAGVWQVEGGMHRLAKALEALAVRHGVEFRYRTSARDVGIAHGHVAHVVLSGGESLATRHVIVTGDLLGVARGELGATLAKLVPRVTPAERSLSALTVALAGRTDGFPLAHHTVFFSGDYRGEFDDLFRRRVLPRTPTVYACAQDRHAAGGGAPASERLLLIINAPPNGDSQPYTRDEVEPCESQAFQLLARCGLRIEPQASTTTTPRDFERLFPGTGGALYGAATHGWRASFRRQGTLGRIPGLYFAGGSAHPGPGVPMAAISGRHAAAAVLAASRLMPQSRRAATPGGTLMRSATTARTRSR
jgi:1-hydroxycarotenoid 3,4-desaturase